ncbi:MAG: hypothetical protein N2114_04870, partial [Candidatus Goldbacteria bacterium]|nr:hypothetical protein [Candidatus Goldiibacteriota bacterium]
MFNKLNLNKSKIFILLIIFSFIFYTFSFYFPPVYASSYNTPDPNFWIPNNYVNTIAEDENYVYLGGYFTYLGPQGYQNGITIDNSIHSLVSGQPNG